MLTLEASGLELASGANDHAGGREQRGVGSPKIGLPQVGHPADGIALSMRELALDGLMVENGGGGNQ